MKLDEVKKAIIIMENEPWLDTVVIPEDEPITGNWRPLGNDFFESEKGVCGPAGRSGARTFIDFGRIPKCPLCNGAISTGDTIGVLGQCGCSLLEIKGNYRIIV